MRVSMLGVVIDSITEAEARTRIGEYLQHNDQRIIVTPNPEFIVLARRDSEFQMILNNADLALPDGVGLLFAARILGTKIRERITGVQFVYALCEEAARRGRTIFFLGANNGVAKKTSERVQTLYPALRIAGAKSGGAIERIEKGHWRYEDPSVLDTIRQAKPDILFVALGQGKQEKWIADNLRTFSTVKIMMGVGGALDYIAGTASWAPAWIRIIGLEWLWRFIHEPRRWRRIFKAVIVFPLVVMYERFIHKRKTSI